MDSHPLQHVEWIQEYLGEARYGALKRLALDPPKLTPKDKKDLLKSLRDTLKGYRERRKNGEIGRLE